ncbi:Multiple sugar-binding protein [Koleobacter methoxysyntrophicus]|jgi:multiple sugar transport system substrate-binding protein|uniref:Multiple sugar-binding protein n=1 Tax=Koleobacter methoxysyntrophicus TaxID=2751313 RepID=A0A8A0RT64_9FIRM|nr:extracellular solute-binding protein [Koleobacter methoxysyntrophicus]QSQ10336.1 Multiple sugar-binding protein [Koleobacter methoxysyntrophicus]
MLTRKAMAIFLVIMIVFSLYITSCNNKNGVGQQREDTEKREWQGIITIWDFPRWPDEKGNRFHWIQEKIKEFEKENPGIFIELRKLDWENGVFELNAALSSQTYPDIVPNALNYIYVQQGYVEPVEEYFSKEELRDFYKSALDALTYDKRIWGFPVFMTTYAMFLNLDIFRERNVEPPQDGIWTWDEFVTKLKKLTFDRDGDGKTDVYGFHSFIKEGYYNLWGIITSDGALPFSDDLTQFTLHYPEGVSGLEKLVDLVNKHKVTPPEFGKDGPNEAWGAFAENKKIAVYPAGSWAVKVLADKQKEGKGFNFGIAGYPVGKLGMPNIIHPCVGGYMLLKQENEKKREACVKFLKRITSPEEQKRFKDYGVFPARKSAGNLYIDNPYFTRIQEMLGFTTPVPNHPLWHKIEPILQREIRKAVLGEKAAKQALEDAKVEIEMLLE